MKTSTTDSLLQKAIVHILLKHPFYAVLLLKRSIDHAPIRTQTACTDGTQIWINEEFFKTLTLAEAVGVLCHEVLHIAFLHMTRIGDRDINKFNYATDYAINAILLAAGITLPAGCLYNPAYANLSAESIYNLLPDDYEQRAITLSSSCNSTNDTKTNTNTSPSLIGQFTKAPFIDKQDMDAYTQRIQIDVQEALQTAKAAGKVPAGLDRLLIELTNSTMNWREILSSYLTQNATSDYSYQKCNSTYLQRGLFVPTLHTPDKGTFVIAADTSASVYDTLLKSFLSHTSAILELSSDVLTVIYCDSEICGVQEVDPSNPEPLQVKGNGGTDFAPVGRWIEDNDAAPELLIYFTDGECSSFPPEPSYPVIWATNNPGFNPPYGINLVISDLK